MYWIPLGLRASKPPESDIYEITTCAKSDSVLRVAQPYAANTSPAIK